MNNSTFVFLLLLAGCSSATVKPSASAPQSSPPATNAPAQASGTAKDLLKEAAAKPSLPLEGDNWEAMFDGKTLTGWRETPFAGHGEVQSESGLIVLNMGDPFTGINWTNDFPKVNYEVALDAMRVSGSDFFCGLTVPVHDSFCSLIVGGWGGSLMGISSLDGMDASENETTKYINFEKGRWYRIRLRITDRRIEAWLDNEKVINVDTTDRRISLRVGDIELSKPFGLASWQTTAALRQIKMRRVLGPAGPLKER
jgi:3-keto-disaccharide hydrolase